MPEGRPPVLFYCPFPPPATGQRVASLTFADLIADDADVRRLPVVAPSLPGRGLRFLAGRAKSHARGLWALRRVHRQMPEATVYFCPASSPRGVLRDLAMLAALGGRARRLVGHLNAGDYPALWRSPATRWMAQQVLGALDALIVPSETQAGPLRPLAEGLPIHVVPNIPDDDVRLDDEGLARAWTFRAQPGPLRVLFASHFIPSKGYLVLLEALARVTTPVRATFVGEWGAASDRRAFLGRARELGVLDRVTLLPPVSGRPDIRDLLGQHHVVALPTWYPNEAQPLTLLEGMANGCVPVSTPHAAIPEYVRHAETGLLVPVRDPLGLASALDRLADRSECLRLGRAARAFALDRYSTGRALPDLRAALFGPEGAS